MWYYKVRPSCANEGSFSKASFPYRIIASYNDKENLQVSPNQYRWRRLPVPDKDKKVTFIEGLVSLMGAGEPSLKQGVSIYGYSANASMDKTAFYNSDGDFLIVPHSGTLYLKTLNGRLTVKPWEVAIIPRGIKFSVDLEGDSVGWVAETFGYHFSLPELGPIGANGLANPVHFQYPTAWFEDVKEEWRVRCV